MKKTIRRLILSPWVPPALLVPGSLIHAAASDNWRLTVHLLAALVLVWLQAWTIAEADKAVDYWRGSSAFWRARVEEARR